MKAFLAYLLLTGISLSLTAQNGLHDPVTARQYNLQKYSSIQGSPFLYTDAKQGDVKTSDGQFTNVSLKFDAYANLLYLEKREELWEIENVQTFTLTSNNGADTVYFKKIPLANLVKAGQFVQVLAEGKLNFYRSDVKAVNEMSQVNAGMVQTFTTTTRYIADGANGARQFKLNKKDVLGLMADKSPQVEAYAATNNLDFKKEKDVAALIAYYNIL